MPSVELHREMTADILSRGNWQFINNGELQKILVEHVAEPDEQDKKDREIVLEEKCFYEGEEITPEECREIRKKIEELKRSYDTCVKEYGSDYMECHKLKKEFEIKEKAFKIERSGPKKKPAKHHEGLNDLAYKYYFVNAVRCYMLGFKEEAMKHLARALHYIQDAPLSRRLSMESSITGEVVRSEEDYHDEFEKEISEIWCNSKNEFRERIMGGCRPF